MEQNATAQSTRNRIIRAVFRYRCPNGSISTAFWNELRFHWAGRMVGGIWSTSALVLNAVRIIHTKGKIMITEPMPRAR